MQAIQTLWAGPWMTNVSGFTATQAALNLFWLNLSMLVTFFIWGFINPYFYKKGISTDKIIIRDYFINFNKRLSGSTKMSFKVLVVLIEFIFLTYFRKKIKNYAL